MMFSAPTMMMSADGDRDPHLLEPQRREERLVHARPVAARDSRRRACARSARRWPAPRRGRRRGSGSGPARPVDSRRSPKSSDTKPYPSRTRAARASRCRPRAPAPTARQHAERRQRALRRQQRHGVADRHAELPRQVLPEQDAGQLSTPSASVRGIEILDPALAHRALDVGDVDLERRVDPLHGDERVGAVRWRRAPCRGWPAPAPTTPGTFRSCRDVGAIVVEPAVLRTGRCAPSTPSSGRAARPAGRSSAPAR